MQLSQLAALIPRRPLSRRSAPEQVWSPLVAMVMVASAIVAFVPVSPFSGTGDRVAHADSAPTTLGRSFTVIFPPNLNTETMRLHISSSRSGTGTYTIGSGSPTSFTLTANVATSIDMPSTSHLLSDGGTTETTINNKVVKVTTSVDASVYADSNGQYISDATVIIPDVNLGTRYRVLSSKITSSDHRIIVVATENSTSVTLTPKTTFAGKTAGTPYTVTLNAGQTYMLGDNTAGRDSAGTLIASNKPVAAFISADCELGPNNAYNFSPAAARDQSGACDLFFEMLPPTQSWGRSFILNGFADRNQGGTPVRILADQDNTVVKLNGTTIATLNAGETTSRNLWENALDQNVAANSAALIETTKPALVAAFMRGGGDYLGQTGDPSVAYIPPFEQFLTSYTVVSAPGNAAQLMNVTIPKSARDSLRFDGAALTASNFESTWADITVNGTEFSVAHLKSTLGSHSLSANQAFGLVVYGANSANSYAYVGGMSLSSIGLVDSVTLTTGTGYTGSVGQQVCITAVVADANGAGLNGVRVDGAISGANVGTPLVGTSNAAGVADLCYTGTNAGSDSITLTSNQLTATTSVTWTTVAPDITYSPSTISVVAGSAMPTLTPTNAGSPATTWSVNPSLPTGLTLNATTGVVSGTPSGAAASATYTVTASNSAGSDTFGITIEVTASAVAASIAYTPATLSLIVNSAMTALSPTVAGTFPTWSVNPALPLGLSLNTQNGTITGTPTETAASATYTVTATNTAGSATATLTISVGLTAPDISYAQSSVSYVVNTAISSLLPTNAGSTATSWSVSPALPAGLSFNSNTGQISGTPTATASTTSHTVTATNTAGSDTFAISITVAASLAAPNITYNPTQFALTQNSAMTAVLPSNSGGPVASWSITPALPAGLVFTTSSGRISGTPTGTSASATYTVTATNTAGTSTVTLTIEVSAAASSSTSTPASSTSTIASNNNASTTTSSVPATSTSAAPPSTSTSTTTTVPATTTTVRLAAAATTSTAVTTTTIAAVSSAASLGRHQIAALGVTNVISPSRRTSQFAVSATPSTCVVAAGKVYSLAAGKCRVEVRSGENGLVLRNWSRTVVANASTSGGLVALEPISFPYMSAVPISSLRDVVRATRGASEILIVGHSAIFTGSNKWNDMISAKRASAVESAIRNSRNTATIHVVSVGARSPLTRTLTESQQMLNRRVMVYIVPGDEG